jgi:RNA recognition motif-containing protein
MTCEPNSIFLCNIPYDVGLDTVHDLFPEKGEILRKSVPVTHSSGCHKGFAFCTYRTLDSCTRAISALNGLPFNGRNLICRMAKIEQPIKNADGRSQPPETSYRRLPPPPPPPPKSRFDNMATAELERLAAIALRPDRPEEGRFPPAVDLSRFSTAQLRSLLDGSRPRENDVLWWLARMF